RAFGNLYVLRSRSAGAKSGCMVRAAADRIGTAAATSLRVPRILDSGRGQDALQDRLPSGRAVPERPLGDRGLKRQSASPHGPAAFCLWSDLAAESRSVFSRPGAT